MKLTSVSLRQAMLAQSLASRIIKGFSEPISSPTFTVINCYEGGKLPIYHFDVYRIEDCDEMYEIRYEEYVFGDGIALIER